MKKLLSGVAALLMMSSVGFASPLTDYSSGKVAVDLSVRSSNDLTVNGFDLDGKTSNVDYGATIGLGNGFAFQYKRDNADSKNYTNLGVTAHTELQSNQYNLLYQLNPNVSAFAGLTNTKAQIKSTVQDIDGKNDVGYQVGFIGSVPIADKTTAYGSLGYGNKIEDYEVGLGYEVAKNTELNVGYKDTKFKKLTLQDSDYEFDYRANGLTYGLTYKF